MDNFNKKSIEIINKGELISFHQHIFSGINFEDENKKDYNNNKHKLDNIIQNLDVNKPIVFIGKGKTLFQPITKENVMKKMGLTVTPYIVAVNDIWILCEEYDFVVASDEVFISHFIKYNKSNKPLLCNIYPTRWIFHPVNRNISTPLFSYTRCTDKQNIIGAFQIYDCSYHPSAVSASRVIIQRIQRQQWEALLEYQMKKVLTELTSKAAGTSKAAAKSEEAAAKSKEEAAAKSEAAAKAEEAAAKAKEAAAKAKEAAAAAKSEEAAAKSEVELAELQIHKIKWHKIYEDNKIKMLDNIIKITAIRGGQMALELFLIIGFKKIYTTGFQGEGYSTYYLDNNSKAIFELHPENQEKINKIISNPNANKYTKPMYDKIEEQYKIKINYF